jgi:hypothetical protein
MEVSFHSAYSYWHPFVSIGHTARQEIHDHAIAGFRIVEHKHAPETIAAFLSVFLRKPGVVA